MACNKCGGGFNTLNIPFQTFELNVKELNGKTTIGVKSAIRLVGIFEDIYLRAGNVVMVSSEVAADLLKKEAPIWILS